MRELTATTEQKHPRPFSSARLISTQTPTMLLPRPLSTLTALLITTTLTTAQSLIPQLSIGQNHPLSSNGQQIPGYHIGFEGPAPSILSDRIILTPPSPGHVRSGLWSDVPLASDMFQLDVEFRASGPERGSGNMQIWFTKETYPASALRSVYTVERFQGLVLSLDQYGGSGGAVRGFLNDGSMDFKGHHNLDSLAFGHCDYPFRNLGRPSRLRVKADGNGLEVLVDDRPCFKTGLVCPPRARSFTHMADITAGQISRKLLLRRQRRQRGDARLV